MVAERLKSKESQGKQCGAKKKKAPAHLIKGGGVSAASKRDLRKEHAGVTSRNGGKNAGRKSES